MTSAAPARVSGSAGSASCRSARAGLSVMRRGAAGGPLVVGVGGAKAPDAGSKGQGSLVVVSGAKARRGGIGGARLPDRASNRRTGGLGRGAGTLLVVGAGRRESPLLGRDATGGRSASLAKVSTARPHLRGPRGAHLATLIFPNHAAKTYPIPAGNQHQHYRDPRV